MDIEAEILADSDALGLCEAEIDADGVADGLKEIDDDILAPPAATPLNTDNDAIHSFEASRVPVVVVLPDSVSVFTATPIKEL